MASTDDNKDSNQKFRITFGNNTSIGNQQIGDVHTTNYNPQTTFTNTNTITIDSKYLKDIPKEYAESLKQFVEDVNKEMIHENTINKDVSPIQTKVNELAEEATKLKDGLDEPKKKSMRQKFQEVATALVKVSPKIAQTLIGFSPLAPFSRDIGETFEVIVESVLNNK